MKISFVLLCVLRASVVNNASAQTEVRVAIPLGVPAGTPAKVTLHGPRLDGVTAVRCHDPFARARLLGHTDARADIELTVPADAPPASVLLTLVGPAGESKPYKLLVDETPTAAEREPNGSFREAQPLTLPATVAGTIQAPQDVDVFRFDGKAGQRVAAEVWAARLGSPLDAGLTLYDTAGRTLAAADDSNGSADPALDCTLPRDGAYFLAVSDARDLGGPMHVYRLLVRAEK